MTHTLFKRLWGIAFALTLMFAWNVSFADDGHYHPDSLQTVTVSGTAIVDSSMMRAVYFLDSDGNGQADYRLNFGPWWYKPDSSEAMRPADGQSITITGGLVEHAQGDSLIIVYEIDGEFWRNPVEPSWDMMGGHQNGMGHHNNMGFAFGWMHDSLRAIALNGSVIADTTFVFAKLYLDVDADSVPDYFLNFGPPWYQPDNDVQRPADGDEIRITGGLLNNHDIPMVIVYTLNGQTWRDSSAFGPHFGSGWIYDDMDEGRYFYSPFDSLDGMYVRPGWKGGMDHGHNGMMSDSLFCQILEVFPQNIPNRGENHVLAGYEIAMFNPDGSNNMWMDDMNGGHMNMNSKVDFNFHYTDIQLQGERIDENTVQAKYWDDRSNQWVVVQDAVLDVNNNTVTFSSTEVSNYVILSGEQTVTALDDPAALTANGFVLRQNYPNPFNPVTTIEYELLNNDRVHLNVYNALGQRVALLENGAQTTGVHRVEFNANSLPSGTYYYELRIGSKSIVRKMTLLK